MRTISRIVGHRMDLVRRFVSSLETHTDEAVDNYKTNMTVVLGPNVPIPNVRETLEGSLAMVVALGGELSSSNRAHLEELADDHHLIVERDDLTTRLVGKLRSVRSVCEGAFGKENLHQVALGETLPRNAAALQEVAELVSARLEASDLELPPTRVHGVEAGKGLASSLEPERSELGAKLARLESEDRQSDQTLIRKRKAIANFDKYFILIARQAETIYRLAGMDEEARRVRPKVRQVSGRERLDPEPAPEPASETSEPPQPAAP